MIRSGIFLLALLLAAPTTADDADFSAPDGLRKGGTLHQNLPARPWPANRVIRGGSFSWN